MDRLSWLPEPILCHILSFLPTKTAVATSILSKRWQSLWTSVAVIDIDLFRDISLQKRTYINFVHFVDEVALLPWKFPIKTFRLAYFPADPLSPKWVAVAGGAEEFHLAGVPYFRFERSFGFQNLQVLKLSDSDHLGFAESGLFPKLRVLHLITVSFAEKGSLENFLAACPVLEELVWQKMYHQIGDFKIFVPTLTSLVVRSDMDIRASDTIGYMLFLETPALEYLSLSHDLTLECLQGNLCKLRRADIDCYVLKEESYVVTYAFSLIDLLGCMPSVEFLKLSCYPIRKSDEPGLRYVHGLVHGLDYSWLDYLHVFHNLVRLEIRIPSCDCVVIPHLLRKFPNLEHIAIKKLDTETAEACWNEPLEVPICLSSSLLSFSFRGFDGFEVEMELVEYIMKHAMVLRNVTLDTSPNVKAFQARVAAIQRLPMGLRSSKACQVNLTT